MDGKNALSTTGEIYGVPINVVLFKSLNEFHTAMLHGGYHETPRETDALTIGEYDNGSPLITVFFFAMSETEKREIIPHEAFHTALAIMRHQIYNSLDPETPIHIRDGDDGDHSVCEESICIISGQVCKLLYLFVEKMERCFRIAKIKKEKRERYGRSFS